MRCFFSLLACATSAFSFVTKSPLATIGAFARSRTSIEALIADPSTMETARSAFFVWFFGASGGGGIALSAFPGLIADYKALQNLKGAGPTLGGEERIAFNFLCGFPESIAAADIDKIVNQKMSIEELVKKFPIEDNFLSKQGYLTFPALEKANKDANPLALRAVFDSLNRSSPSDPVTAEQKFEMYRRDVNSIKNELLKSKLAGWSAILTLLFLLSLAGYESFFVLFRQGWFPEWPGLDNFPFSLFDSESGFGAIPKYWIDDPNNQ